MNYLLPKIWMGRIQKYWDKIMPSDFPHSNSEFALKFDNEETRSAVNKMESELHTEDSVFLASLPTNTFVSNYIGTYDVKGVAGELTLLSPEKVSSDNVIALHYNEDTDAWDKIEDIQIKDGYVWGTLDSFSPIAIAEFKKDIHLEALTYFNYPIVVCEGIPVKVKYNDNNKIVVISLATGKEIELTEKSAVVGGSIDKSPIDSTSITVVDVPEVGFLNNIYGGSIFYDESEDSAVVKSVNVTVVNSTVKAVSGSYGAVRTDEVNISVSNSTITSFVAAGQSYISKLAKDCNGTVDTTLANRAWVKKSNITIKGCPKCYIVYGAGNSGYMHVEEANLVVDGLESCDYFTPAGSNGNTRKAIAKISNMTSKQLQFTNRGKVGYSAATVVDSNINLIAIGGDNSEGDVDGLIDTVRIDINAGNSTGVMKLGVNGTETITADHVEVVKVSRNAGNITVDDAVKSVLGDKFIIK